MKKLMAHAVAMAVLSMPAVAQTETLFDADITSGGYGGPALKVTKLNDQAAVMMGGSGAWVINSSFNIGIAGYGIINDVTTRGYGRDTTHLAFAYGGLVLGYQFLPDKLVHLGVQTLIGGGGVGHRLYWRDDAMAWESDLEGGDPVFVWEPGVTAELNISRLIRLQLEGGFRFVSGVELPGASNGGLTGFAGTLTLKFGSF